MAGISVAPAFEPSFKATMFDAQTGIVEVVGGLERVWTPHFELQKYLAGQLLLLDVQPSFKRRIALFFQAYVLRRTQQSSTSVIGEGPGCVVLQLQTLFTTQAGKVAISVPRSVLEASLAGRILLRDWDLQKSYVCT